MCPQRQTIDEGREMEEAIEYHSLRFSFVNVGNGSMVGTTPVNAPQPLVINSLPKHAPTGGSQPWNTNKNVVKVFFFKQFFFERIS